jgi:hypothetical protein
MPTRGAAVARTHHPFEFPSTSPCALAPQVYVEHMSDLSSQQVARHRKQGRSRVTNGSRTLIGVKGSSKYGRRFRDLIDAYTAEIGGDLTQFEKAMVKQAAALAIKGEMMQAQVVNNEPIDLDAMIRLSSEVRRILAEIAGKAGKRKPVGPTLAEYLANRETPA